VSATWAATDYVLFRGYITSGFPQTYSKAKKQALVPLECYDAFAILNETALVDMYYGYIKTGVGSLAASWRRLVNRALVDRISGDQWPLKSSAVTGAADLGVGLSDSDAVVFDGTFRASGSAISSVSSYNSWSFAAWVKFTSAGVGILASGTDGTGTFNIAQNGGYISATWQTGAVIFDKITARKWNDGSVHLVCLVVDSTGPTAKLYIDGYDDTASSASFAGTTYPVVTMLGDYVGFTSAYVGTVQDMAIFTKALSSTEMLAMYRIGLNAANEDTGTRIGRALDSAGWPSAWRAITTQPYGTCAEVWSSGDSALSQLQLIAATEQGAMFVTRDGNITLKSRYTHDFAGSAAKVVQITLSDDGSDSAYVDLGFVYDDQLVQNQITVSSEAGSAFYLDQTSIDKYGLQDASVTTQLGSYTELRAMAEGLIYWRKAPQIRTTPITLYPQTKTSTWPTILGLDLGYRIQVELTPPGVAAQYTAQQLIQQLDWDISSTDWAFTVQGSPVPTSFGVWDSGDDFDASVKFGF
jgi:hypothetical protein